MSKNHTDTQAKKPQTGSTNVAERAVVADSGFYERVADGDLGYVQAENGLYKDRLEKAS